MFHRKFLGKNAIRKFFGKFLYGNLKKKINKNLSDFFSKKFLTFPKFFLKKLCIQKYLGKFNNTFYLKSLQRILYKIFPIF